MALKGTVVAGSRAGEFSEIGGKMELIAVPEPLGDFLDGEPRLKQVDRPFHFPVHPIAHRSDVQMFAHQRGDG